MKVSPARRSAFDVLLTLENFDLNSSALLAKVEADLDVRDAGLCHELVLGTLRKQLLLDKYIASLAGAKKLDGEVRIALRLGLYQIMFLSRVPAHAVVNESVGLVQMARKRSASGLVNAILRKASIALPELRFQDDLERLSVETSHPKRLLERWVGQFGYEETEKLAQANNEASPMSFRVLGTVDGVPEETRAGWQASEFVKGCFTSTGFGRELIDLERTGKIYLQEEGSQMVGHTVTVLAGARFLDVCGAPGGKTGMIARSSKDALLVAGDRSSARVNYLRENLQRQNVRAEVIQYNAVDPLPLADGSFDAILLDAPCTGTGTIRSNPEIRYRVTEDQIARLSHKQLAILRNASKLLKKGGLLVYSTCSIEAEENEAVISEFLSEVEEFQIEMPQVPARFLTPDGFARTSPARDGMDAFFIAAIRRI